MSHCIAAVPARICGAACHVLSAEPQIISCPLIRQSIILGLAISSLITAHAHMATSSDRAITVDAAAHKILQRPAFDRCSLDTHGCQWYCFEEIYAIYGLELILSRRPVRCPCNRRLNGTLWFPMSDRLTGSNSVRCR
ncbi:hypothetical protein OE88DRAFT_620337 [Heliocybe sulcata]|uniref:Uncharacterized protein n=1 Tax=Heliocybe sulcata TaxID=5364 RepID=A0A5C3NEX3_9AGAM|nr:hypothetical protein OE88DRAFT_620337 [Heliocybe sulcata]